MGRHNTFWQECETDTKHSPDISYISYQGISGPYICEQSARGALIPSAKQKGT